MGGSSKKGWATSDYTPSNAPTPGYTGHIPGSCCFHFHQSFLSFAGVKENGFGKAFAIISEEAKKQLQERLNESLNAGERGPRPPQEAFNFH